MKEDKIFVDIYRDEFDGEMKVNIGHSTHEENITVTLRQAREMIEQLPEEISKHISQELYDEHFGKHK